MKTHLDPRELWQLSSEERLTRRIAAVEGAVQSITVAVYWLAALTVLLSIGLLFFTRH